MTVYGIDVNALTRPRRTGVERYVYSLVVHMMRQPLLPDERVLLYASAPIPDLPPLPQGWDITYVRWPLAKGWTHGGLSLEILRRTPNVFFSPAHEIPLFTGRTKIVSTVHDVAFAHLPDVYGARDRRRQEWAVKRAAKKADALITISDQTMRDMHELYNVPNEKMHRIHLAVDRQEWAGEKRPDKRYLFTLSRLEKKKNITHLVRAFAILAKRIPDLHLVLGGSFGFGEEEIRDAIEESGAKERILLSGYIKQKDVSTMLRGAAAYVFPTVYEGFGLPALEAMAAGTPLICSDIPVLREVAGDAALYAPTDNPNALAQVIERVLADARLREDLIAKGYTQLTKYDWNETARCTFEALRRVLSRSTLP